MTWTERARRTVTDSVTVAADTVWAWRRCVQVLVNRDGAMELANRCAPTALFVLVAAVIVTTGLAVTVHARAGLAFGLYVPMIMLRFCSIGQDQRWRDHAYPHRDDNGRDSFRNFPSHVVVLPSR